MADSDTTGTSVAIIAPELQIVDGHVTTTSVQVAEHFGKAHAKVLRDIRNLLDGMPEKHKANFGLMQIDVEIGNGAIRKDPAYRLTRDGFTLLAMGFTGKEALQWKLAYIDTFNRMEAALTSSAPDRITPAQKQHLKELVDLIVASGKQDYPGTWARFQRKMGCNKYELLHPSKFDAAVAYLQGKLDDQSIATLIQKHLPGAVPALKPPVSPALPAPAPKTDMDTASLAFALAVEAAARIQRAVFDAVMATGKPPGEVRIMAGLTFDKYNGAPIEPWVYFVKPEEMLTSFERLAKDIADPGMLVSNAELANLTSAFSLRLAQRMSKQSKPSQGEKS